MPAPNLERRDRLADAAVELLAHDGAHGLTHRAVERAANLPTGTASNYFPTRTALFVAAARRILELHRNRMTTASDREPEHRRSAPTQRRATELLTESLVTAATVDRDRYRAIFELWNESLRRPELDPPLADLQEAMVGFTLDHHRQLGLAIPPRRVPLLMQLYGAVLHNLVRQPIGSVDRPSVRPLARAIVRGVLAD